MGIRRRSLLNNGGFVAEVCPLRQAAYQPLVPSERVFPAAATVLLVLLSLGYWRIDCGCGATTDKNGFPLVPGDNSCGCNTPQGGLLRRQSAYGRESATGWRTSYEGNIPPVFI